MAKRVKVPKIEERLAPGFKRSVHTKKTVHETECILLHVRDGDSIVAYAKLSFKKADEELVIRLDRGNCPESKPTVYLKHTPEEAKQLEQIGIKAAARTASLLANPLFKVTSRKTETNDTRGRLVCEAVQHEGLNIMDILLKEKLAVDYDGSIQANSLDFSPLLQFWYPNNG